MATAMPCAEHRPGNLIEVKDPKIKGRNASGINLNEIGKKGEREFRRSNNMLYSASLCYACLRWEYERDLTCQ